MKKTKGAQVIRLVSPTTPGVEYFTKGNPKRPKLKTIKYNWVTRTRETFTQK